MQKPEAAVAAMIWQRWDREEISLSALCAQLQAAGWERRAIFARIEREAEEAAARQALGNRPMAGRLRNY